MLEKSEKIEGLDLKAVFSRMLKELPWEGLRLFILSNPQLSKICTSGGFRLDPKFRSRMEQIVSREAERNEYSDLQCNGIFAAWYPVHKELHSTLEEYFHSDEYKAYLKEKGLGEDEYVLSDEKFDSLYNVKDFEAWRILLCFSPMKFNDRQKAIVVEDKKSDADMMNRLNQAEADARESDRKVSQLNAELERLRSRQQSDQQEIQELRRQNRQLKSDNEQLQKRVDIAVAEMKRSNQQVAQSDAALAAKEASVREELGRVISRQESDLARLNKEIAAWQARHEEQCGLNRGFVERADAADKRLAEALASKAECERRLESVDKMVDGLLSHIDWGRIGADMKLSPTMKRNFASLLKTLDYDENRNLTIEGTLPAFWDRLMGTERKLISEIAKSTEEEVRNGSIKEYWDELAEDFTDVATSLEARGVMLGILQGIFYQTFSDADIEAKAMTPKAAKPEKAEAEEPAAEEEPVPAKAPAKKAPAKKPAAKSTAASKTTAKKPAAKAADAKKPAAKASTAKKSTKSAEENKTSTSRKK